MEIEISFLTAMLVPEKADDFGLKEFRTNTYRNVRLSVAVQADEELFKSGAIRLPEKTNSIIGECDIYVKTDVFESVSIQARSNEGREMMRVEYEEIGNLMRITVSFPPPLPEVLQTIPMPVCGNGERFANNLVSVQFTNEAYLYSRERREPGKPPKQNARPQFLDAFQMKQAFHDQEGSATPETGIKYPFLQFSSLYVQCYEHFNATEAFQRLSLAALSGDLEQYLDENPELYDPATYLDGLHTDLIQMMADGDLDVYLIPSFHTASFQDIKASMKNEGGHLFEMRRFPMYRLLEIQSKKLFLERIQRGFERMTDKTKNVFGLTGFETQEGDKTTTTVTAFVFGWLEKLYKERPKNGEPVLNDRRGKLIIVPWRVVRPLLSSFFEFYANGDFQRFVHRHGLLIGEHGFAEEKARERKQKAKAKKASSKPPASEKDDGIKAPSTPPVSEPEPESELPESSLKEDDDGPSPESETANRGINFDDLRQGSPDEPDPGDNLFDDDQDNESSDD